MKLIIAAMLLGVSGLAQASGFALTEQNASSMGNAFAGAAAAANDASSIFFNPAGMSFLPDKQLVVTAHAIDPSVSFSNNGSKTISSSGTPTALYGANGGDASSLIVTPNLYFAKAIGETLHLGLGVNSPFGLQTQYNAGWAGRYQALDSELQTININPSIAYKASEQLSLGAGFSAQYADATLSNALDMGTLCYGKLGPATCSGLGTCRCRSQH